MFKGRISAEGLIGILWLKRQPRLHVLHGLFYKHTHTHTHTHAHTHTHTHTPTPHTHTHTHTHTHIHTHTHTHFFLAWSLHLDANSDLCFFASAGKSISVPCET